MSYAMLSVLILRLFEVALHRFIVCELKNKSW